MADFTHSERDRFAQLVAEKDFNELIAEVKGEGFREYRRQWARAGEFEEETPVPCQLDFELSTYCNYRCPMCPFGMPQDARPEAFDAVSGYFPFELYRKVIDEGAPLGVRAIDLSYYNEPLLRRDLIEFVTYAESRGILDIMFSTNAQLLSQALSETLLGTGLTRLLVSLDAGTEETFKKVRVGGDFHKVVRNLEYFLRRKKERRQVLPITRVSFVKTKLNEHELPDFITRWKPLVDYLSIQELVEMDGMQTSLTPQSRLSNDDFHCHHPWHRMTLRANGDALPCCTVWGQQLPMGNVNRQSIAEIWTSAQMRSLRRLHKEGRYYENPVCKKCAESSVVR